MAKARNEKGLTQKELAARISEKPTVVTSFEQGKAIPNPGIIRKIERALGTTLPKPQKPKKKATADPGGP